MSSRAATGRIATAQAEGHYGVSEGAADVFEVTVRSVNARYGSDRMGLRE